MLNKLLLFFLVLIFFGGIGFAQDEKPTDEKQQKASEEDEKSADEETLEDYTKYLDFAEIAEGKFRFKTAIKYRKKALKILDAQNEILTSALKNIEDTQAKENVEDVVRYLDVSNKLIARDKIQIELEINCCKYILAEDEKENGGNTQEISIERKFVGKRESKIVHYQKLIEKYDVKKKFKKSYKYRILLKLETKQFQAFINGKIKTYESLIKRLKKMKKTKDTKAVGNAEMRKDYYNWVKKNYKSWLISVADEVVDELTPEFNMDLHFFLRNQDKYSHLFDLPTSLVFDEREKESTLEMIKARGNYYKTYPPKKPAKTKGS